MSYGEWSTYPTRPNRLTRYNRPNRLTPASGVRLDFHQRRQPMAGGRSHSHIKLHAVEQRRQDRDEAQRRRKRIRFREYNRQKQQEAPK